MSTTSHVTINSDIEDEHEQMSNKICEYPPNLEGRVSIFKIDLQSLEETQFLNDQIISKFLQALFA
jgi:Ulp1 family protease